MKKYLKQLFLVCNLLYSQHYLLAHENSNSKVSCSDKAIRIEFLNHLIDNCGRVQVFASKAIANLGDYKIKDSLICLNHLGSVHWTIELLFRDLTGKTASKAFKNDKHDKEISSIVANSYYETQSLFNSFCTDSKTVSRIDLKHYLRKLSQDYVLVCQNVFDELDLK